MALSPSNTRSLDLPMIVCCIAVEVLLLGITAVRCACRIAAAYEHRPGLVLYQ